MYSCLLVCCSLLFGCPSTKLVVFLRPDSLSRSLARSLWSAGRTIHFVAHPRQNALLMPINGRKNKRERERKKEKGEKIGAAEKR